MWTVPVFEHDRIRWDDVGTVPADALGAMVPAMVPAGVPAAGDPDGIAGERQ